MWRKSGCRSEERALSATGGEIRADGENGGGGGASVILRRQRWTDGSTDRLKIPSKRRLQGRCVDDATPLVSSETTRTTSHG